MSSVIGIRDLGTRVTSSASGTLKSALTYDRDRTVHSMFRGVAANARSSPALLSTGGMWTYGEVESRSNQLARRLRSLGLAPGKFAGVLARRSPETIVAILAILKCGAAYVPLDPGYPDAALNAMIADCAPQICLVEETLMTCAPHFAATEFLSLEDQLDRALGELDLAPALSVPATAPAYIMYTSGSTGAPKGVVVPHRAIVRLVCDQWYASFGPDETFLHLAPLAFDASTLEIWGALLGGGRLAIVGQPRPSLEEIAAAIAHYKPTAAWFTAGLFHLLVDHYLDALRPLRQLLAGGDVLSPEHFEKARRNLPGCTLINGYGPTENTTFTCCYRGDGASVSGRSIPIGRPIAHTDVHILDEQLQPVADGECGVLYAGGDGLAIGYHNRPDWTAEKFVRDPFSSETEARLYCTGDYVRRRADGNIEFIGRADRQVKIDGRRIELDEIESALRSDPGLADAVVMLRTLEGGGKRIAAFVIPNQQSGPDLTAAVPRNLKARLPAHMMPSELTVLQAFPLNTNGKVDRKALLEIKVGPANGAGECAHPIGGLEQTLAEIWMEVLQRKDLPRQSNFFDLGGTSLQLIELHAKIQAKVVCGITLMELFEHPNLASLADFLSRGRHSDVDATSAARSRCARQSEVLQNLRSMRKSM